jgi:predicted porin
MNNKIKLAVAGAVLSVSSFANAGIIIPAGDWTIDINGNVNAFANRVKVDKDDGAITGGLSVREDANNEDVQYGINTGLLPSWLGFTGTTRQNDVDVSFTISFQPNASDNGAAGDDLTPKNRQAFLTFGDKSWGTVKVGKDLGIYAGNAILNDMTLLGVGGVAVAGSGGKTTWGGIGTGYQYAAWKGQISYTTPNMNGFSATIGITNPNQGVPKDGSTASTDGSIYQDRWGIEGQVQYEWTGDIAGKVWASGASYDVTFDETTLTVDNDLTVTAWDIGAAVSSGNLGLTAYYYDGSNNGTTTLMGTAFTTVTGATTTIEGRDGDGGYLQATYVIPTGTKLGLAYGESNLDKASGETDSALVEKNSRWTVGAYHPLTKHLNLVAEYNKTESESHNNLDIENDVFSLGAILFF